MLTSRQHALSRANRITSSRIRTIATGDYRAWNTLSRKIREAKPAPIGSRRDSGVASLDWGHNNEPQACSQFWLRHPEYEMMDEHWCHWHDPRAKVLWENCGTSPDKTLYKGFDRVSGLEAKCPWIQEIHRTYWSCGVLPYEYQPQVFWHMIVTDCLYWWFISYDPRDKNEVRQYFELKVYRDPAYESELMDKVNRFLGGHLAGEEFKSTLYNRSTYEEIF